MKFDPTSLPLSGKTTSSSGLVSQSGLARQPNDNGPLSAASAMVTAKNSSEPNTASIVTQAKLLKQLIAPASTALVSATSAVSSSNDTSKDASTTLLAKVLSSTVATSPPPGTVSKFIDALTSKSGATFTSTLQSSPLPDQTKTHALSANQETSTSTKPTEGKTPVTLWSNRLQFLPVGGSEVNRPIDATVFSDKPLPPKGLLAFSINTAQAQRLENDATIVVATKTVRGASLAGPTPPLAAHFTSPAAFAQPSTLSGTLLAQVISSTFIPDEQLQGDSRPNSKLAPAPSGSSGQIPFSTNKGKGIGFNYSELPTLSLTDSPPKSEKISPYAASLNPFHGDSTNTTRGRDHSVTSGRWLLTLNPLNAPTDQPKVQVLTSTYLPAESVLTITTTITQEKLPFGTLPRELTTIIREGLNTARLEARPITDIAKLIQAIDNSKQPTPSIDQSTIDNIRRLVDFGIHKGSDFKQLLNSIGVFSSQTNGSTSNHSTIGDQRLIPQTGVAKSTFLESKTGPITDHTAVTESSDRTLKDEIISLLVKMNIESAAKPQEGVQNLGSKDPLSLLMDLLARPIGSGASNRQDGGDPHNQRAKALVANVLKQVLLGIQGTGLKSLAEQHQIKDSDNQSTQLLSIELPIHWSSSIGKTLFKVFCREHWQDEETTEESAKIKSWQFELTMDFPGNRILTTRCTLDEHQVRIQFWANQDGFKKVVEKRMQTLRKDMEKDGINVDYCGCALGLAPDQTKTNYFRQLIDTKV